MSPGNRWRGVIAQRAGIFSAVIGLMLIHSLVEGFAESSMANPLVDKAIPVGDSPWDVAVSNDGRQALVSTANAVEVVDLISGQMTSRVVMTRPRQISVAPQDGLAAAIVGDNRTAIAIFDFKSSRIVRSADIPGDLQDLQFSADGTELFAAAGAFGKFGTVHRLDASDLTIKSSLSVRENPRDLTLGPDAVTLYIACTGTDGILAWDTRTADQVKTITTRPGPRSIAFSPDGRLGYITYAYNPGISVFDRATGNVIEELVMPRTFYADNSAVNPRSGDFYLAGILVGFAEVDIAEGRITGDVSYRSSKDGFVKSMVVTPSGEQAVTLMDGAGGVYAAGEVRVLDLPLKVPSEPRDVKVRVAGTRGVVEWTAPTRQGTSTIQRYRVRVNPGNAECTTRATRCRVKGLRQGVAYSITVQAENAVGWGEAASARGYSPSADREVAVQDSQPVAGKPTQVLW